MPPYLVVNQHAPENCHHLEPGMRRPPPHLKGKDFYCPCPYGEHAFYMIVEGETAEEVIGGLPIEWQPGTRATLIDIYSL